MTVSITLNIPSRVEATLRQALGPDLEAAALEALLIEGYRTGKLSTGDIAEALGYATRIEAERWLSARQIDLNYTITDLEADRATLDRVLGPVR
jgi:predicted HTH domain antitoxin